MLLSDFGLYESQLKELAVINAPNLEPDDEQHTITMRKNLITSLMGMGLIGVDVSVERII